MPCHAITCHFSFRCHRRQGQTPPQFHHKLSGFWWRSNRIGPQQIGQGCLWPVPGRPSPFHSEGIPGRKEALFELLHPGRNSTIASGGAYPLPFVVFLRTEGLRHQTAKSYLSAVRHLQISQGLGDPRISSMPHLELVVRGLKREQAGIPGKARLPITPAILKNIYTRSGKQMLTRIIQCCGPACACASLEFWEQERQ